jgi:hypothetical protein
MSTPSLVQLGNASPPDASGPAATLIYNDWYPALRSSSLKAGPADRPPQ